MIRNKNGFTLIELLAVIVILGILTSITVDTYKKYISASRDSAYTDAIANMKTVAANALFDCSTGTSSVFCNLHHFPTTVGGKTTLTLGDLVDANYIDNITDPASTNKAKCDRVASKVLVENTTSPTSKNVSYTYYVCLVCGDYESELCSNPVYFP